MLNFEIKPFDVGWVVQKEKDMCLWGAVEDYMVPWSVVGKGKNCYWLVLKLQEGMDIGQS